jgi:hypothetical protein
VHFVDTGGGQTKFIWGWAANGVAFEDWKAQRRMKQLDLDQQTYMEEVTAPITIPVALPVAYKGLTPSNEEEAEPDPEEEEEPPELEDCSSLDPDEPCPWDDMETSSNYSFECLLPLESQGPVIEEPTCSYADLFVQEPSHPPIDESRLAPVNTPTPGITEGEINWLLSG